MLAKTAISSGACTSTLRQHRRLADRYSKSEARIAEVREAFAGYDLIKGHPLAIFCAGSLARMEIGAKSDLDLFVTADGVRDPGLVGKRLFQISLFSEMIRINERLRFPSFSNDGEYLNISFMDDLTSRTGSRLDDSENLFTTRMLLILEGRFVANETVYQKHRRDILDLYYRDRDKTISFKPIFLLNDLLRYWRTMCLNYEERRHEPNQPFRKKNVNLKFSRMLTVFGTVLPLVARPADSVSTVEDLCKQTPLERLATGLDILGDEDLIDRWRRILDIYEEFLSWKEKNDVETFLTEQKDVVNDRAKVLSTFLYDALSHRKVPDDYRRFLIL